MKSEATLAALVADLQDAEQARIEARQFDGSNLKFVDAAQVHQEPGLAARCAFLTSATICRPAPSNVPAMANEYTRQLHARFAKAQESLARKPDMTCLRLRDIHFIGKLGTLFDAQTSTVLSGHLIGWGGDILRKRQVSMARYLRAARRISKPNPELTYVLLDQPGIKVYGHFLLDIVPKIHIAETLLGSDTKYILGLLEPWALPLLAQLGIARSRIISAQKSKFMHFDELHVPFVPKWGFGVNVGLMRDAWSHFVRSNPNLQTASPPVKKRRLFLSRASLVSRPRAANEDELFAIAERYGFERIAPETMPFPKQVKLFSDAEYIIGEDGSALHNTIFSTQGRAVIAFMRPDRDNLWHLAFAQASGLDFHAVKCKSMGGGYSADPVEFDRLLRDVIT